MSDSQPARLPIVVLISGSGSNLQAIINAAKNGTIPIEIRAVISNRADAYGLERARLAGITTEVIDHTGFKGRGSFDAALMAVIDQHQPALVVLAGFMRILTPGFVRHYIGRMLNIHPSLLPHFTGLHTHRRAIEAKACQHGASIHFVTEQLDGGPVIIQAAVPVLPDDTEETLARRVLHKEHLIYPLAIGWFALGRLRLEGNAVILDGEALVQPVVLDELT